MKDDLEDIKKEFERLLTLAKSNPEIPNELVKEHEKKQLNHLKQFQEQIAQDKEFIKETNDLLEKQSIEINEFNIVAKCMNDHRNYLENYHKRFKNGEIKSCFFQDDVVAPIIKISTQFCMRIFDFSNYCFNEFEKNNYAGLILVRANIENLILFYYYIRQIEKLSEAGEWLKIAKLNLRIQYVKSMSSITEFDRVFQMDYMDYVKALTSTELKDDKTIHINDALKVFFKDMKDKYALDIDIHESKILKEVELITLIKQIFYNEDNYFMLCEIVHPVAISRKPYPMDKDPNSARHIFANSHRHTPFCTSLFFHGVGLYEKLKKINDPLIEDNLRTSINKLVHNYNKNALKKMKDNSNLNNASDLFKKHLKSRFKKFDV